MGTATKHYLTAAHVHPTAHFCRVLTPISLPPSTAVISSTLVYDARRLMAPDCHVKARCRSRASASPTTCTLTTHSRAYTYPFSCFIAAYVFCHMRVMAVPIYRYAGNRQRRCESVTFRPVLPVPRPLPVSVVAAVAPPAADTIIHR
jgi:hypothetical protein